MENLWFFGQAILLVGVVALLIRAQFREITVHEWEVALLYRNGKYREALPPGRHWLVRGFGKTEAVPVRTFEQWSTTGLVDATSADKLPFRLSAWFVYKVSDARSFHERLGFAEVQRAVAAGLVELAAQRRLEELLAGRADADAALLATAGPKAGCCELVTAQLDTIQLPPETRRLFAEVERARLEGLAALERARGEHAALRSLANAARLLKDNPDLLNLRLLQSVSNASKGSTTIVLGQGSLAEAAPATPAA